MELLIPGLILVALMVWASTKIKRNAAAAFEPETIETDEFVIQKPDGFLHVVNDDSGLAFRAYSKDYGQNDLSGERQSTIEVAVHRNSDLANVVAALEQEAILADVQSYLDGGEKAMTFVTDLESSNPRRVRHYKLVARGTNIIELCFAVLYDNKTEFSVKIDKVRGSFRAK